MIEASTTYAALAHALAPPSGDASAFLLLGLSAPGTAALEAEHVALFGRAGETVVSPYEGVYREAHVYEILAAYAAAGLAPDPSFRDRPDHVSAELAFMAALSRREEEASQLDDAETRRRAAEGCREFFHAHVWSWIPSFLGRIVRAEGCPLHGALAEEALRFLRREGARWGADSAEIAPAVSRDPPAQELCTTCGKPLGVLPPDPGRPRPSWACTCIRCRVRADLRRTSS